MSTRLAELREKLLFRLESSTPETALGVVEEVRGNNITAVLQQARIGDTCLLRPLSGPQRIGEIIAIDGPRARVSCYGDLTGICNQTQVVPLHKPLEIKVGDALLGRVITPLGDTLEAAGASVDAGPVVRWPVLAPAPAPLDRQLIETPVETGIRVVDTLLATAEGQRMGIFGGAGMGKSTLTSMLVNNTECDVAVIGLIGERAREIKEFWERGIASDQRERCVVVASTSDRPAVERRLAGLSATAIAEAFAERGKRVLLIIDSLTRIARAQREIGLAAGEPPSRRGFPPSTFAFLSQLVERAGPRRNGMITAFYTVLVEGEASDDPVAEELKALLDGHVMLSSDLSQQGHFPSIDVPSSRSRLQSEIVAPEQEAAAAHVRSLISKYREIELLLQIGEYSPGSDPLADEAIEKRDRIAAFLRQRREERTSREQAIAELIALAGHDDDFEP